MAEVNIPTIFLGGFKKIATIPKEAFTKLVKEIGKAPDNLSPSKLEDYLLKKLGDASLKDAIRTVISIANLYHNWEGSESDLVNEIAAAFDEKTGEHHYKILQKRLTEIFKNYRALDATFKAVDLISETSQIYRRSRIITDIRLIFNEDIADANRKAVIVHQLKIEYIKEGKSHDVYFALDRGDLNELREHITRALAKEQSIKNDYSDKITFHDLSET